MQVKTQIWLFIFEKMADKVQSFKHGIYIPISIQTRKFKAPWIGPNRLHGRKNKWSGDIDI